MEPEGGGQFPRPDFLDLKEKPGLCNDLLLHALPLRSSDLPPSFKLNKHGPFFDKEEGLLCNMIFSPVEFSLWVFKIHKWTAV